MFGQILFVGLYLLEAAGHNVIYVAIKLASIIAALRSKFYGIDYRSAFAHQTFRKI